jgi:hypothetical protein
MDENEALNGPYRGISRTILGGDPISSCSTYTLRKTPLPDIVDSDIE